MCIRLESDAIVFRTVFLLDSAPALTVRGSKKSGARVTTRLAYALVSRVCGYRVIFVRRSTRSTFSENKSFLYNTSPRRRSILLC